MSEKSKDRHNRWRSKTVAFRMSPEENDQLDIAVKLSGLTKQDYLICRALQRDVVVQGNPRVYKSLRNQFSEILSELQTKENPSDELLETISLITATMNGLREDYHVKL